MRSKIGRKNVRTSKICFKEICFRNFRIFIWAKKFLKIKLSSFWIKIEFAQKRVDPKLKWSKTRLYLMSTNMISLKIHDSKTFSKDLKILSCDDVIKFLNFVQLNVLKNFKLNFWKTSWAVPDVKNFQNHHVRDHGQTKHFRFCINKNKHTNHRGNRYLKNHSCW